MQGIVQKKSLSWECLFAVRLSGLAGGIEVTGVYHRVIIGFGEGMGFDALAVTLLANSNPIGVIFSALFFGALRAGSMSMQRGIGVPSTVLYVIRGAIILSVLIGFAISNSRRCRRSSELRNGKDRLAEKPHNSPSGEGYPCIKGLERM